MNALNPARTGSLVLSGSGGSAPQGVELRHLRYFVAVAEAGTFTQAAERIYLAQPTLSQQIRRLEEMVGTPLFRRRREGVRLTEAGMVLLEESRTVLSLIDHGVSRTRQARASGGHACGSPCLRIGQRRNLRRLASGPAGRGCGLHAPVPHLPQARGHLPGAASGQTQASLNPRNPTTRPAMAHAAREVQRPGREAWAGSARESPKALATAVSAQRIRVGAVSGCSP
jgi:DNA-binding MarR family transcriptional regulator